MKTKRIIAVILSVILIFGLTGCGDTKTIKSAKFVDTINKECGAPPEVLSAIYVYYIQGSGNESALQANLRLSGDEGYRDNSKNKVDYQMKTDNLAISEGYATVDSISKKHLYWGGYVLSDDKETAEEMRQAYLDALEDLMWKNIPASEYSSYGGNGESVYYFQGHSVSVEPVIGPVYWDVKEDSGETLYGMIVFYY